MRRFPTARSDGVADESEETYEPDNAGCTWRRRAGGLEVVQPPTRAGIEKTFAIRERGGRWLVEHRLRRPRRMEAKRMLRTRPGTIERMDPARGGFHIQAPHVPGGAYPLD